MLKYLNDLDARLFNILNILNSLKIIYDSKHKFDIHFFYFQAEIV